MSNSPKLRVAQFDFLRAVAIILVTYRTATFALVVGTAKHIEYSVLRLRDKSFPAIISTLKPLEFSTEQIKFLSLLC